MRRAEENHARTLAYSDSEGGPMIVAPQHSLQEEDIRRLEMLFTLISKYYALVKKSEVWKVTLNLGAHISSDFKNVLISYQYKFIKRVLNNA
jgi:hypothetical protein